MKTSISKSKLKDQIIKTFNKHMGGDLEENPKYAPNEEYMLNISIKEDGDYIMVDIEAETYFDQNATMSYWEYKSLMEEFGTGKLMTKDEYYDQMSNTPTLVDDFDKLIKSYNPDWYFELYDACHIQACLDNCKLEP